MERRCCPRTPTRIALVVVSFFAGARCSDPDPAEPAPPENGAAEAALHRAARDGDVQLLRSGVRGPALNARDLEGRTPLFAAIVAGRPESVSALLDGGADVELATPGGRTPLIEAAERGQSAIAHMLVTHGADLNKSQRGYGSPLEVAEKSGHPEIAAMLRAAGARSSGHSLGDTVCVRPWGGDGYCGKVVEVDKTLFRIQITRVLGCEKSCAPKAECSAGLSVGGEKGLHTGDEVTTVSWCLTDTGVEP